MIEMNAALLSCSKGVFLSLFSWIGSFGYEKGNFSCSWATETENRSYTFLDLPSLKRTITTLTSFFLLLQEPKTPIATATSCSWSAPSSWRPWCRRSCRSSCPWPSTRRYCSSPSSGFSAQSRLGFPLQGKVSCRPFGLLMAELNVLFGAKVLLSQDSMYILLRRVSVFWLDYRVLWFNNGAVVEW